MTMTPHGDVVPSFLDLSPAPELRAGGNFDNVRLRVGEVKEIVWPDDDRSRTKTFTEYRVYVQQRGNGVVVGKIYENCLLLNPVAGLADRARWTLRPDSKKDLLKPGDGSKVLILCINGETNLPVIIGGVRDAKDDRDPGTSTQPLHEAELVFNGIRFHVNDDGELEIKYTGKSKADGSTDASSSVVGARVKFDKDGNILVVDGSGDNGFLIDHKNGKVTVQRDKAFEVGDATDAMLLGTSYRNAQAQAHAKIQGYLKALQTLVQTAATQLNAAGAALTASVVAAGAAAPVEAAAAALLGAGPIINNIGQAISDFEQAAAQKNSFCSKLNKLD